MPTLCRRKSRRRLSTRGSDAKLLTSLVRRLHSTQGQRHRSKVERHLGGLTETSIPRTLNHPRRPGWEKILPSPASCLSADVQLRLGTDASPRPGGGRSELGQAHRSREAPSFTMSRSPYRSAPNLRLRRKGEGLIPVRAGTRASLRSASTFVTTWRSTSRGSKDHRGSVGQRGQCSVARHRAGPRAARRRRASGRRGDALRGRGEKFPRRQFLPRHLISQHERNGAFPSRERGDGDPLGEEMRYRHPDAVCRLRGRLNGNPTRESRDRAGSPPRHR